MFPPPTRMRMAVVPTRVWKACLTGTLQCKTPFEEAQRRQALRLPFAAAALLAGCAGTPRSRNEPMPSRDWSSVDARAADAPPGVRAARNEVVIRCIGLIGTPYVWGGTDPDGGFDCSGLVVWTFAEALRMRLPRTSRALSDTGLAVSRDRLAPGDLVFFNTSGLRFSHVGIYVSAGRFVHAPSAGKDVRLVPLDNPWWRSRFNGARRLI